MGSLALTAIRAWSAAALAAVALTTAVPFHRNALAQAYPNKPIRINFSSPGVGSANHLAGEMFRTMAGINTVHVPYKGIPEALTAVVSASVQFIFSPVVNVLTLVRDGRIKPERAALTRMFHRNAGEKQ